MASVGRVQARLGEVRRDLADCAQITQVLSQKVEARDSSLVELCEGCRLSPGGRASVLDGAGWPQGGRSVARSR